MCVLIYLQIFKSTVILDRLTLLSLRLRVIFTSGQVKQNSKHKCKYNKSNDARHVTPLPFLVR